MMWAQIEQIILLTCVNLCSLVPDLKCCMEILGFDIMLDEKMKPWLLEVNSSPAMSVETDIDVLVKPALIRDAIRLSDFETYQGFNDGLRKKQTAKASNIHQNFFSKRTTATNKRDEDVGGPISTSSASTKTQRKPISVKEKYDSRLMMDKTTSRSQYSRHLLASGKFDPNKLNSIEHHQVSQQQLIQDLDLNKQLESSYNLRSDSTKLSRKGKQQESGSMTLGSTSAVSCKQKSIFTDGRVDKDLLKALKGEDQHCDYPSESELKSQEGSTDSLRQEKSVIEAYHSS
jgi:hypothetical protein